MNRKYILKNRKRFYIFIILLTFSLSCTFLMSTVNGADTNETFTTVIVEQGDTLWDLASEYNTEGDIRQYIRKIEKANHLTSSMIFEGDVLKLPV